MIRTAIIVEARYYPHLSDMLLAGARAALEANGVLHRTVTVPGALEIPGAIASLSQGNKSAAFVALGVVIRGETYHFEVVADQSARAIMDLTLKTMPVGNGILTVENEAQALERADPARGDKGGHAAIAALALAALRPSTGYASLTAG